MSDREKWCRHYNGAALHDECKAGVRYADFGVPFPQQPCCGRHEDTVPCPSIAFYTTEEFTEQRKRLANRVAKLAGDLEAGRCTVCHQPAKQRQVGPCVYGDPCGHRMFQGRAQKAAKA